MPPLEKDGGGDSDRNLFENNNNNNNYYFPNNVTVAEKIKKYYAYGIRNSFGLDFDPVSPHHYYG
jgi:glucose/arabinose dehydrogenase